MQEALRLCLEPLTPNNRELLRLRYFERRSCAEVALIMAKRSKPFTRPGPHPAPPRWATV